MRILSIDYLSIGPKKAHQASNLVLLMLLLGLAFESYAQDSTSSTHHPLAVHMNQWLEGSREWSTPNPDHDASDSQSFAEYRVRWDWGPFGKQLLGKLFGVREDGSMMLFWNLYSSYDPGKETVIFQQVGLSGAYIHGEHPVRNHPTKFDETERLDTYMSGPDGSVKMTRHDTIFRADGTHESRVFEQSGAGEWKRVATWTWALVTESDVMGTRL